MHAGGFGQSDDAGAGAAAARTVPKHFDVGQGKGDPTGAADDGEARNGVHVCGGSLCRPQRRGAPRAQAAGDARKNDRLREELSAATEAFKATEAELEAAKTRLHTVAAPAPAPSQQISRALVELLATLPSLRDPSAIKAAGDDHAKSVQEAIAKGEPPPELTKFLFERLARQLELAKEVQSAAAPC